MYVRNNGRIDFDELEQQTARIAVELQNAVRQRPGDTLAKPLSAASRGALSGAYQMTTSNQAGSGRSLRQKLLLVAWGIAHAPALLRRAIRAVFGIENLQPRTSQLEVDAQVRAVQAKQLTEQVTDLSEAINGLTRRLAEHADAIRLLRERADRHESVASRMAEELGGQIAANRREIMFQQRRLSQSYPAATGAAEASPASADPGRLDSLYAAFEDTFRGEPSDIKQRLRVHGERLSLAGAGHPDTPVLDIGCGRGEWLELLREAGMAGYGIDSNLVMVERCRALGLDARHSDLLAHFRGLSDASLSAVTAFHVVEHLPFEVLVDFLDEALRALAPGGVLLLETPNAETMRVGATTFYNDPTHRNPVLPGPLTFILEHRGFTDVEVVRLHPFTQGLLSEDTDDARLLNRVLFGPQDYAIAARRG